jgi:group I intron endonuclease
MIIYKATNTVNGKCYIGKTKNSLESRIKSHKIASTKKDSLFYRAINKYGFDNFKWEVITKCDDINELNNLEKKYISENYNGYNIAKGGDGGDTISNHPNIETIKNNVSKFHKGKILSKEHKEKISEAHKGKTKNWAKDTAKKMSEKNKNKPSKLRGSELSEEHKEKISKTNKGKSRVFSEEHKKALSKAKENYVNPNKGKTYEEIMGHEKALEFKKQQSEMRKGRVVSEETKKKISEYHKNKKNEKDGISDS